jgi:integrase
VKKDGTSAIMLRIGRDNRTLPIPTQYSVPEKFWDDRKREVKKTYEGVKNIARFNNLIDDELKEARSVIQELDESGLLDTLTLAQIKDRIIGAKKGNSFIDYAEKLLKSLKKAKKIGTHDAYQDAVNAIAKFHGSRNLDFKQITYDFLTKWETKHFADGFTPNGLAAYMRGIRAIYNRAIKSGVVDGKYYPFKNYTIKTRPTEKRALEWPLLSKIIALNYRPGHPLFHTRNYFIVSYMLYGMNFFDMAMLTPEHLVNGRVNYRRNKTSKLYDVKITKPLQQILQHYLEESTTGYIFSVIKRESAEDIAKDIEWARKRYNTKLKKIAEECGIQKNLTSYVSRHSFATQALLQKVPLAAISAMLGHSSLKTTQIYLDSLPSETLDEYNSMILDRRV